MIPLVGSGDRLLGLRLGDRRSLKGFKSNGCVDLSQLGDSKLRGALLRGLLGKVQKQGRTRAALSAGPDVKALLVAELEVAERRSATEAEARLALTHLKGL